MAKRASKKSKEEDDFKSKFRKSKEEPSKKTTKKVSKKVSKKASKPAKKIEPYCGIKDPLPKNKSLGNMEECYTIGEVRYYGLNKIDSKVIENKKKKDIISVLETDYTMLLFYLFYYFYIV